MRRSLRHDPPRIGCDRCGYLIYDYPRASTGFVITRGRSVLVLRRAHRPKIGHLDFPGGFIEAGETLEGAARRELLEETGLRVGRASWLGPYWDRYFLKGFGWFPTLNFYFLARWRSGIPRANDDAASAEWMPLDRLGGRSQRFAWRHMREVLRDLRVYAGRRPSPRRRRTP